MRRIEGCFPGTDITGSSAQLLSNGISIAASGPYVQRHFVGKLRVALSRGPALQVTRERP